MRFYLIDDTHKFLYAPTIADAHKRAKDEAPDQGPKFDRFDVSISEVEVPTDKAGILTLLNDDPGTWSFKILRTWELTGRGGLKEVVHAES